MLESLQGIKRVFFIGIAGAGMSALAQYLKGIGLDVSGSDRYFTNDQYNEIREKLEADKIACYPQDGKTDLKGIQLVVASTAIEQDVPEMLQARNLQIPVIKRSELLALISQTKRTIAIGGTSGKSTTTAMLFEILSAANLQPGIISGAGLTSLISKGKIGNAAVGDGEWLVVEADESDRSIIQYQPEIGVLLNIDKDHQKISELIEIFSAFRENTLGQFIVNRSNLLARNLSKNAESDFAFDNASGAGYIGENFRQNGFQISFSIRDILFRMNTIGRHNMENALAAITVANQLGVSLEVCAAALEHYAGIYRRHQVLGKKNEVWVIDDYAHNPVKCAASIAACQPLAPKVIAWFQPHGYGPTRFLKDDFIKEFSEVLRNEDEIWMSEIFYAGGTALKDISSKDLTDAIRENGKHAFFIAERNDFLTAVRPHLVPNAVLLLMGARDPDLEFFVRSIFESL